MLPGHRTVGRARDGELTADGMLPVDSEADLWRDRGRSQPRLRSRLRRRHADVVAIVALGGGLGSVARYGLGLAVPAHPGGFPVATLLVNLTGSFALGFLMVYVLEVWPPHRYLRPFLAVGFLGGYTTFSTYAAEIRDLFARGAWALADSYALDSMVAGLAAVGLGVTLARLSRGLPVRRGRRRREGSGR